VTRFEKWSILNRLTPSCTSALRRCWKDETQEWVATYQILIAKFQSLIHAYKARDDWPRQMP
jgi:hypothetical protein